MIPIYSKCKFAHRMVSWPHFQRVFLFLLFLGRQSNWIMSLPRVSSRKGFLRFSFRISESPPPFFSPARYFLLNKQTKGDGSNTYKQRRIRKVETIDATLKSIWISPVAPVPIQNKNKNKMQTRLSSSYLQRPTRSEKKKDKKIKKTFRSSIPFPLPLTPLSLKSSRTNNKSSSGNQNTQTYQFAFSFWLVENKHTGGEMKANLT